MSEYNNSNTATIYSNIKVRNHEINNNMINNNQNFSVNKNNVPEYYPKAVRQSKFIEVNSDNFERELTVISNLIEDYPNISMVW